MPRASSCSPSSKNSGSDTVRGDNSSDSDKEPPFREPATDWLEDRRRNSAIRPKTIELKESRLTLYLLPMFGDLLPSQITPQRIEAYPRGFHEGNEHIRAAADAGKPLLDPGPAVASEP